MLYFSLLFFQIAVDADSLQPGECPLFYCVDPATMNSTDVFCARRDADQRIGLYKECPTNYFCSIRELYDDFLQSSKPNTDCRVRGDSGEELYFNPVVLDATLEWKCINDMKKELAYGSHPKSCVDASDCEQIDGSRGTCVCAIQPFFHNGYCAPDRLSKVFDMLWKPCPAGYVADPDVKLYLQALWMFYVYVQVQSVTCAQGLFYENLQVWDAAAKISLETGQLLTIPLSLLGLFSL